MAPMRRNEQQSLVAVEIFLNGIARTGKNNTSLYTGNGAPDHDNFDSTAIAIFYSEHRRWVGHEGASVGLVYFVLSPRTEG